MDVSILGQKYFTKLKYVTYDKFASIDIFQNLFAIDHFYIVSGYVDSVLCKTDYKLQFIININVVIFIFRDRIAIVITILHG